jgi:SsrA-binding protein
MAQTESETRLITSNKRARFEYEVLEELECGLALTGTEVKALRAGRASIQEAFGMIREGELWLLKSNIPVYAHGNIHNHEPDRDRKLLAKRKQIEDWHAKAKQRGMTIIPLQLYFKGARVKIQIALCKGKKLYDKRQTIKERDDRRDTDRDLARRRRD